MSLCTTPAWAAPLFRGRIVDPTGRAVPGAQLSLQADLTDGWQPAAIYPGGDLETAPDGTFTYRKGVLHDDLKAPQARLVASAPGYSSSEDVLVSLTRKLRTPIVLALRPAVEIRVVVLDDVSHAPIEGAEVAGYLRPDQREERQRTGPDGVAVLHDCDDRSPNTLTVAARGYARAEVRHALRTTSQTITLALLHHVRVRIVDASSGKPLPHCRFRSPGTGREDLTTTADGTLELSAPYGDVFLEAACEGYHDGVHLQLRAVDANTVHELRLHHDALVEGRVVDGTGQPVAGINVEARPVNEIALARPLPMAAVVTDAEGRFHFNTSFYAEEFSVYAYNADLMSSRRKIVARELVGPIELVVRPIRR